MAIAEEEEEEATTGSQVFFFSRLSSASAWIRSARRRHRGDVGVNTAVTLRREGRGAGGGKGQSMATAEMEEALGVWEG